MSKFVAILLPLKNWIAVSLAFWAIHIVFRILLLFRNNPYGFPFVSKPDWYIFHAVTIDFMWIVNVLLFFLLIAAGIKILCKKFSLKLKDGHSTVFKAYCALQGVLLLVTYFDQEVLRFLGSHLSFGLVDTYKDTSSISMFWDYVANDLSVPYLQFFVLALALPVVYGIYRLIKRTSMPVPQFAIGMAIFYLTSFLFVYVIWTGNARMAKLRPVVTLVYNELFEGKKQEGLNAETVIPYKLKYQNLWQKIEGNELWEFSSENATNPLYRSPKKELSQDSTLLARREKNSNVILVFLESHRGLNTGFLNPQLKQSPTPFYDSIAATAHVFERMHTSGLPTTGAILSTHTGIPHHSSKAQATELAHVNIPSFASILRDSGYVAHYFSAADPAWDNLSVWMSKWYNAQHYNRSREDDSSFFDHAATYIRDTLARQNKPFLATLATRSNHYPFNFAAGMTDEQKKLPLTERINVTMNYADRQLARFVRSLQNQEWYKTTYLIIMADHAFPLGENGVSTMNGGSFSNATWIPFIIKGPGIEPARDSVTTGQLDIAPTITELVGIVSPNMFMGHNLLRNLDSSAPATTPTTAPHRQGLSLGAYSKTAAIGMDGYRLIQRQPLGTGAIDGIFAEGDTHQKEDIGEKLGPAAKTLANTLDSLIKISDYALEKGL